ncbi:MAG: RNA polymerase sigma factor FliA [Firmicutes bacterium]|nr:RNA polymerase sigma factor FliA [candidate division NPL-UPA2 bacterium]
MDRDELVLSYLPLVRRIAGRIYIPSPEVLDREDLVAHGVIGLLEAAEKFDPARETSFASFAYRRIRGAMLDSIRGLSFSPRMVNDRISQYREAEERLLALGEDVTTERMAAELSLSVSQIHALLAHMALRCVVSLDRVLFSADGEELQVAQVVGSAGSPDPARVAEESELMQALATALLHLPPRDREMLALYYVEELTLKEIACVFGVTEGRVSQLHSRAIESLRQNLRPMRHEGVKL